MPKIISIILLINLQAANDLTKQALFGSTVSPPRSTNMPTVQPKMPESPRNLMDFEPSSTTDDSTLTPSEFSTKFTRILDGRKGDDITDFETVPSVQRVSIFLSQGVNLMFVDFTNTKKWDHGIKY